MDRVVDSLSRVQPWLCRLHLAICGNDLADEKPDSDEHEAQDCLEERNCEHDEPWSEAIRGELAAYRVSTSRLNIVGNVGKEVPEFDFGLRWERLGKM